MKEKLWIGAGVLCVLALGACEARVTTNNGQNSVVIRTDNAAREVENAARNVDDAARRLGDAVENRVGQAVEGVRNTDVDIDIRDRRDGNAATER